MFVYFQLLPGLVWFGVNVLFCVVLQCWLYSENGCGLAFIAAIGGHDLLRVCFQSHEHFAHIPNTKQAM